VSIQVERLAIADAAVIASPRFEGALTC